MTPSDLTKAIQNTPTLPWRGTDNGTHIFSRQGHELGRFVSREARDLAVGAVNGAADLLSRIASLELDLEAARKQRDAVAAAHVRLGDEAREMLEALCMVARQHYSAPDGQMDGRGLTSGEAVLEALLQHGRVRHVDGLERFAWVDKEDAP